MNQNKVGEYQLVEQIGSGAFSDVFKAYAQADPTKFYAVKCLKEMQANTEKAVTNQIRLLQDIKDKGVVNYIKDFKYRGKWYIVLEYCGKGDLQKFLRRQKRLPEAFCKNLASSVVNALSELHKKGIAHRDLKLPNILINDEYDFKIADFGMAKVENSEGIMQSYCGTPYAMAPEVLKHQSYDLKCDTWSLGVMVYQCLFGIIPFSSGKYGPGLLGLMEAVIRDQPNYKHGGIDISQQCLSFLKQCLQKDPARRPLIKDMQNHPWLRIGVDSTIRRDFLRAGLEDKQAQINKVKKIIKIAIEEHIKQLVRAYTLVPKQIDDWLNLFKQYYKQQQKVLQMLIFMLTQTLCQISQNRVHIYVEDFHFSVPISRIKIFNNHMEHLAGFLKSQVEESQVPESANIEKELICFVINQADCCISPTESIPPKVKLLKYISKLPLVSPEKSAVTVKFFTSASSSYDIKVVEEFMGVLGEEELLTIINEHSVREEYVMESIIEHQFDNQPKKGVEFELGSFISTIIEINCPDS